MSLLAGVGTSGFGCGAACTPHRLARLVMETTGWDELEARRSSLRQLGPAYPGYLLSFLCACDLRVCRVCRTAVSFPLQGLPTFPLLWVATRLVRDATGCKLTLYGVDDGVRRPLTLMSAQMPPCVRAPRNITCS